MCSTALKPDLVYHIGAIADARAVLENPVNAMQVNVMGTANVFEAARLASVDRVIFSSTVWVANAMGNGVVDEESWFNPAGAGHIYTTTKMVGEFLAHDYLTLYGQKFTILRYGIPYGPRMWAGLVLQNWCQNALEGKPLVIFGDGSATRRFVNVGDLARAHALATQEVAENQVYNLEGMRAVSIKELAEAFSKAWPEDVEIVYRDEPNRIGELRYQRKILSNNKAYADLGWEPRIDLTEGVQIVVDWFTATNPLNKAVAV